MAKANLDDISPEEFAALEWIKENAPDDAVIIASPDEGNLITGIAERKNVIDSDFLLQTVAKQRFDDLKRIYTAYLEIEVVGLMNKYDADFIYFSKNSKPVFNADELHFIESCFEKVYDDEIQIYQKTGCVSKVSP